MKTKIIKINSDSPEPAAINEAVGVLRRGGLVAFPTETVYGLGANRNDALAVERLYTAKRRPKDKPFAFIVAGEKTVEMLAGHIEPAAYRLFEKFWPGPLTVVLGSHNGPTMGFRMPRCQAALQIIQGADFPIVCPSANISEKQEPLTADDVLRDLDGRIDLVLDGGKVAIGVASTVVDARELPFQIIRKGFIEEQEISKIGSQKRIIFVCSGNSCRSVMAQALLQKKLRERNRADIEVLSAGITVMAQREASAETQELLKEEGLDVSGHRAQRVQAKMLKGADLILVMERLHEERLAAADPSLRGRIYLLKEFSQFTNRGVEVQDPMGCGMQVYRDTFIDIKESINRLIDLI